MKAVRSLSHRRSDDEGQIDAAARAHAKLQKKCVSVFLQQTCCLCRCVFYGGRVDSLRGCCKHSNRVCELCTETSGYSCLGGRMAAESSYILGLHVNAMLSMGDIKEQIGDEGHAACQRPAAAVVTSGVLSPSHAGPGNPVSCS